MSSEKKLWLGTFGLHIKKKTKQIRPQWDEMPLEIASCISLQVIKEITVCERCCRNTAMC